MGVWAIAGVSLGGSIGCSGAPVGARPLANDASADGPQVEADAGSDALCADLADAAWQRFDPIVQQNVACSEDTDCVSTPSDQAGWCVAPCGWLSNDAGVAAVQSAANTACQPFLAQDCVAPASQCPVSGSIICAGGICARYDFYLGPDPLPTFTHGVCTALQLDYGPSAGSPNAPRDLVDSITASNGTLYSDPQCTMPLTTGSLTIPSGSSSIAFGFTPTAPGNCLLELGTTYGLTAQ
jgi:hypothetical protein